LGKEAALFGRGVLEPTPMFDVWDLCVRQDDPANHSPPAASSAAIARDRCFAFIVFCSSFKLHIHFRSGIVRGFLELAFDLERRRGIVVRSASELG
jgi:hypothetical protein